MLWENCWLLVVWWALRWFCMLKWLGEKCSCWWELTWKESPKFTQRGAEAGLEEPAIRQAWAAVKLAASVAAPGGRLWNLVSKMNQQLHSLSLKFRNLYRFWPRNLVNRSLSVSCKRSAVAFLLFFSHLQFSRGLEMICPSFIFFLIEIDEMRFLCLQLAKKYCTSFISEYASNWVSCIKMPFDS